MITAADIPAINAEFARIGPQDIPPLGLTTISALEATTEVIESANDPRPVVLVIHGASGGQEASRPVFEGEAFLDLTVVELVPAIIQYAKALYTA